MRKYKKQSSDAEEFNEWGVWERLSSATGIVFGILLLLGLVIEINAGFPPTGDSASKILQYFSSNQSAFKIYLWTALASIPFQIWFFSTLFVSIRRVDKNSIWCVIGLVSAVISNAASFYVNIIWGALTWYINTISDSSLLLVMWGMYHLGGTTLGLFSSMILLGFGLAMLRINKFWHKIGIFGIIIGIYSALVFIILCFSGAMPSPLSGISYILFIVWILVASAGLTFGQPMKLNELH